jgi:ferrochelatase
MDYDAILLVSFGGPEKREDVIPFLENVLKGKNVPRERMLQVAEHYYHLGGKSPLNDQNRALIAALHCELEKSGLRLPIYWGNRNWHPLLRETLRVMQRDGVRRALAFVTSAYSSYSSCRQYLEDIARAQALVGEGAPVIDKLRVFYNHPGFIAAAKERAREALAEIPAERREAAHLLYTAHSIPLSMAQNCRYVEQLEEACRLVSQQLGRRGENDQLVYQSRSGPPTQPWLGPDIIDYLHQLANGARIRDVVVVPIGFISDHMEVLYDLDTEARRLCSQLGLHMIRAATVGTHPEFVRMIRDLILERIEENASRKALGRLGPEPDVCKAGCCLPPGGP